MGKNFKWLAKLFCVFGTMVGLFGIGTFTQVNGITSAVNNFFDPSNVHTISLFGMNYSISVVVAGIIVTICAGLVIIGGIKRISKPGLRVYAGKDELPRVLGGLGIAIISTSKGVMTDKAARNNKIGGEVLAYVW